jgi:hypothetical protein
VGPIDPMVNLEKLCARDVNESFLVIQPINSRLSRSWSSFAMIKSLLIIGVF